MNLLRNSDMNSLPSAKVTPRPAGTETRTPVTTLDGHQIYLEDDDWYIPNAAPLHIANVTSKLHPLFGDSLRRVMEYHVRFRAWGTAQNALGALKRYVGLKGPFPVTSAGVMNAQSALSKDRFEAFRMATKKWHDLGYPGVHPEAYDLLCAIRIRKQQKLAPVRSWDPKKGPLTAAEHQDFIEAAIEAFDSGKLSLSCLAMGLLLAHSGRRPVQLLHLRLRDLLPRNGDQYMLSVPRAKQHGGSVGSDYNEFALSRELWIILRSHRDDVIRRATEMLSFAAPIATLHELPMWPRFDKLSALTSLEELRGEIERKSLLYGNNYLDVVLKSIGKATQVHSTRVDGPIPLYPYRFRYTVGVAAAREGYSELEIAELLDHLSTDQMDAYTKSVPEHAQLLQAALGSDMRPYARMFQGQIVDNEADAERGGDPRSRVTLKGSGMGTCGSYGYCGAGVPIPCYTCHKYQPWVDGPHEKVLEYLVAERQAQLEATGDEGISAVLDRTIVAVTEVIRLCRQKREQRVG